jgi:membrane-associated phospholipid phosphatase
LKTLLKNLKAVDFIIISFQIIILCILFTNSNKIENNGTLVFIHFCLLAFLLSTRCLFESENRFFRFLNLWVPYIIVPLNFSQLPHIIPAIYIEDIDGLLIHLDYSIFGAHPTVLMEKIHWPIFTEFLQLVYTTFYFLPVVLIYRLNKRAEYEKIFHFQFVFFLGFYLSYIGYLFFPSIGPRFTLQHYQTFPLEGIFLSNYIQNALNNLEQINRDAFPSGHTLMTILSMIYVIKYDIKLMKPYVFITIFMIISTVYLRYHYVVDVLGGILFVLLTIVLAKFIYKNKKETFVN